VTLAIFTVRQAPTIETQWQKSYLPRDARVGSFATRPIKADAVTPITDRAMDLGRRPRAKKPSCFTLRFILR
jgi:hypothetical protein